MLKLPTQADCCEVVILADGDFPTGNVAAALLRHATRVVCCDGAAVRFTEQGGAPQAIVGDGDSLPAELRARYADCIVHVAEQESNDLTKAVRYCMTQNWHHIVILGATGRREDHTLGNISLLLNYMEMGVEVRMVTDYGAFDPIVGTTQVESHLGQQISLFADCRTTVSGDGLKYTLPTHLSGWWSGTLNESLATQFTIHVSEPALLYRLF
ncbi:MAG: thiamine diphosphokinase [Alistipes sp.]